MERLIPRGRLPKLSSRQISESRLGLGMEKLDRDSFEPEKVYDRVAALGVKWIRLQSGWQKTEQEKGRYDFRWLDSQVDNLLRRGLQPWLCLCYGNPLYDDTAGQYLGSVGCPPIRTEEALNAWKAYVRETAKHFAGRIVWYEIWNEPEGDWTWRTGPSPEAYAAFCRETASAVRESDPGAKIITGSHYLDSLAPFTGEFAHGMLECSDAVSFHSYQYDERKSMEKARAFRRLAARFGKGVEVIQGESGSQSKSGGNGALYWVRTDETMQTKQLLRHVAGDLLSDVKFTSVFSCVDMAENLDAKAGKPIATCGYFGLLGADFDPTTGALVGDYHEKPSYYAFQNLCSLFGGKLALSDLPVLFTPGKSERTDGFDCPTERLVYGSLARENGAEAFVYWCSTDMVTVKDYEGTVSLELYAGDREVTLADPRDGRVYDIPESILTRKDGLCTFRNLPVKDTPLVLCVGDFACRAE